MIDTDPTLDENLLRRTRYDHPNDTSATPRRRRRPGQDPGERRTPNCVGRTNVQARPALSPSLLPNVAAATMPHRLRTRPIHIGCDYQIRRIDAERTTHISPSIFFEPLTFLPESVAENTAHVVTPRPLRHDDECDETQSRFAYFDDFLVRAERRRPERSKGQLTRSL